MSSRRSKKLTELLRPSVARLAAMIALAIGARGTHAEISANEQREAARRKIALMTEEERARLNSHYEEFKKLSPDEQRKFRELDRTLRNDPELQQVKRAYIEFLEPLSAGERMDLESQADPIRRASMVRAIIKEHQDRSDAWERRGETRRGLKPQDLAAVLRTIETHWRTERLLTKAQTDDLDSKKDIARQIAIYDLAFARPMPGDRLSFLKFPPQLLEEIRNAISDPAQKQPLADGDLRDRARFLVWMIYFGLSSEIESQKPKDEVLGEFLAKLSGAEQGEILKLPDDQQQRALLLKYAEANPDKMPRLPTPPRGFFGGDRLRRREFGPGRNPERDRMPRQEPLPEGGPPGPPRGRDNRPDNRPKREKPTGEKSRSGKDSQVAS